MTIRADLEQWILDAVASYGGNAKIVEIAEFIWKNHQGEISGYPKGLYTWQYDMRWASQSLRDQGKLKKSGGIWSKV